MEGEQHWALKFPSCWLSPKKIKKGHVRRESESHTLSTVDNTSSKTVRVGDFLSELWVSEFILWLW